MADTFIINLAKSVKSAKILDDYSVSPSCSISQNAQNGANAESFGVRDINSSAEAQQLRLMQELEKQKAELAQLCRTLNCLVGEVNKFYDEVLTKHKEEVAKLSVEIANKVLMQKVQKGDYQIESIVKEALKNAPAHQEMVVHLNPEDLPQCQKLQQDDPGSAFAVIKFVADQGIGRAECLLETPKGIIKSFIDEHMERISEALEKVE